MGETTKIERMERSLKGLCPHCASTPPEGFCCCEPCYDEHSKGNAAVRVSVDPKDQNSHTKHIKCSTCPRLPKEGVWPL